MSEFLQVVRKLLVAITAAIGIVVSIVIIAIFAPIYREQVTGQQLLTITVLIGSGPILTFIVLKTINWIFR
jgi:hypothetical protein